VPVSFGTAGQPSGGEASSPGAEGTPPIPSAPGVAAPAAVPGAPLAPGPPPVPAPATELRYAGVSLLSAGDGSPEADLELNVDEGGVRLSRPDGSPVWIGGWEEIGELAVQPRTGPCGELGVVLVIGDGGPDVRRLLVPAGRADRLAAAFGALARCHGVAPLEADRLPPWPLTALLIAAAAAGVAFLLLAAGHVHL